MFSLKRRGWLLVLMLAAQLVCAVAFAGSETFMGVPSKLHWVKTGDGARLTLFELERNEKGPPVLLEPGLFETAKLL